MFTTNPKNTPIAQLFTAAPDVDAGVFVTKHWKSPKARGGGN